MNFRLPVLPALLVLVCAQPGLAATDDGTPLRPRVALPVNVTIDESHRDTLEETIALSATLRRQLGTISHAPARVDVRVSPTCSPGHRAVTNISRYREGLIKAEVLVPAGPDFVELLAHEFEHIVEQIEGVDLRVLLVTGGATRDRSGVFETERAREAGRAVMLELKRAGRRR